MNTTRDTPVIVLPQPRTSSENGVTFGPVTPAATTDLCRCGHSRDAHEHYRPGSDCSACGSACGAFRARTGRGARSSVVPAQVRRAWRALLRR
ncbi:hypothetical protein [Pseudonocardia phyllosphaerae]|uniref:hypothetical protein n=1 Tax=Pseudonocardia phyllosphaerae TaxID=3390502 RepID=UPI00397977FF